MVFIGQGSFDGRVPRSVWSSPFCTPRDGSLEECQMLCTSWLSKSDLTCQTTALVGKLAVCDCSHPQFCLPRFGFSSGGGGCTSFLEDPLEMLFEDPLRGPCDMAAVCGKWCAEEDITSRVHNGLKNSFFGGPHQPESIHRLLGLESSTGSRHRL